MYVALVVNHENYNFLIYSILCISGQLSSEVGARLQPRSIYKVVGVSVIIVLVCTAESLCTWQTLSGHKPDYFWTTDLKSTVP